jgi:hypothetical protein
LNPRRFISFEIFSDNGDDATTARPLPFNTLPSVKDQQKSVKLSPCFSISQKI